jgi:nicotinamidase-related amidase
MTTMTAPQTIAPQTILTMAGAPLTPSALDSAALVLIDLQREYTDGALPLVGVEAAVAEAAALLTLAREHGVPVIHVVHHGKPGGAIFNPDGPFVAILPAVAPLDGETIVVKSKANSFTGTTLEEVARATGRTDLIIAGFMTHNCVSSTVRGANDRGWRVTVVSAATATRDLPDGQGGIVTAAELQRGVLTGLSDTLAVVVTDAGAWG